MKEETSLGPGDRPVLLRRPKGDWAIHSSVSQLHQSLLSLREDKYSIWIKRKVSSHSLLF